MAYSVLILYLSCLLDPLFFINTETQENHALGDVQAREDELRIQKRFLNQMFAQVKQEFLEKRLRQQQIEQLLGHKSHPALPSTEADPTAGLSKALAAQDSTAEASEASPGEAPCTHSPVSTVPCGMFYMTAQHPLHESLLGLLGLWQAVC